MLRSGREAWGAGNVFIANTGRDSSLEAPLPAYVEVAWLSPKSLIITYDPRLAIFERNTRVDGISVQYGTKRFPWIADSTRKR